VQPTGETWCATICSKYDDNNGMTGTSTWLQKKFVYIFFATQKDCRILAVFKKKITDLAQIKFYSFLGS
jgi:hypothetical protein